MAEAKRLLKSSTLLALALVLLGLLPGCSHDWDEKADKGPKTTREQLRVERGAEAKAKIDKIVAVLEAAMRVPRTRKGDDFVLIQNAIRVTDMVVAYRRSEGSEANTLLFSMADVSQEFGQMLDKRLWAAERKDVRWKDVSLSNSAAGFFDLSGVARWTDPDAYYERDKKDWKVSDGSGLLRDLDAMSRLKYVVVMKEMNYKVARVTSSNTYEPGFFIGHALVYEVEGAKLVGQFTIHAKSSKKVSGNVDSISADLRIAVKKQIKQKITSSVDENATITVPEGSPTEPPSAIPAQPVSVGSVLAPKGERFSVRLPGAAERSLSNSTITYKLLDAQVRLNFIITIATIAGATDKSADELVKMSVNSLRGSKSKNVQVKNVTHGKHKGAQVSYGLVSSKDPAITTPVKALIFAQPPKVYSLYVARLPGGDAKLQEPVEKTALATFQLIP